MTVYLPAVTLPPARVKRGKDRPATLCECGDHAFATLTRGMVALVSPEDIGAFNRKWIARKSKSRFYASRTKLPEHRFEMLHNLIVDRSYGEVDHINTNSLDNRRPNLRNSTHAQNMWNVNGHRNKKSGLPKGVTRKRSRFTAVIMVRGKFFRLGSFSNPEDASAAYITKAQELHKEFARANGVVLTPSPNSPMLPTKELTHQ